LTPLPPPPGPNAGKTFSRRKTQKTATTLRRKREKKASPLQRSSTSTYGHSPGAGPRATRPPDPNYSLRRAAKRTARRARGAIRRESPSQGSGPAVRAGPESIWEGAARSGRSAVARIQNLRLSMTGNPKVAGANSAAHRTTQKQRF